MNIRLVCTAASVLWLAEAAAQPITTCTGTRFPLDYQTAIVLPDNTMVLWAASSVNVDGMRNAYHKDNIEGGGLIHLCNGGACAPNPNLDSASPFLRLKYPTNLLASDLSSTEHDRRISA